MPRKPIRLREDHHGDFLQIPTVHSFWMFWTPHFEKPCMALVSPMVSGHASFGHNRSMEQKNMFLTCQPSQPSQPMQLNQDLILFPIQLGKCPIPQKCMSAIDCTLKDRNVECMITLRYKQTNTTRQCNSAKNEPVLLSS